MIILPGARYDGMLPRPLKGIAGRSNEKRVTTVSGFRFTVFFNLSPSDSRYRVTRIYWIVASGVYSQMTPSDFKKAPRAPRMEIPMAIVNMRSVKDLCFSSL